MTLSRSIVLFGFLTLSTSLTVSACDDTNTLPANTGGTTGLAYGGNASTLGSSPTTGIGGIGVNQVTLGGATNTAPPSNEVSALPAVGEGMITNWTTAPYLFGPWFTYGWGPATGTACTPTPAQGIVATEAGMCMNWSECGVAGQGAALGFKVCAAPKYPNETGESTWFPLACTATNDATCVPSEQAKPIGFCGGVVKGVSFAALTQAVSVSFLDDVGTDGTVLESVTVAPGTTSAAFKGDGTAIAAVHFKIVTPAATGSLCLSDVKVLQ